MELALVQASRRLIEQSATPAEAYDALVDLYSYRQPNLSMRTSKSDEGPGIQHAGTARLPCADDGRRRT